MKLLFAPRRHLPSLFYAEEINGKGIFFFLPPPSSVLQQGVANSVFPARSATICDSFSTVACEAVDRPLWVKKKCRSVPKILRYNVVNVTYV